MRVWTVHPRYLDGKGLVAAWREGLLAQKVLRGETRGSTRHPQLARFRAQSQPVEVVAAYLALLGKEGVRRGESGSEAILDLLDKPLMRSPFNSLQSRSTRPQRFQA